MERCRKMLRAIRNSCTMRLMLAAQTEIHYSRVQKDIWNICVNTTSHFVRNFKVLVACNRLILKKHQEQVENQIISQTAALPVGELIIISCFLLEHRFSVCEYGRKTKQNKARLTLRFWYMFTRPLMFRWYENKTRWKHSFFFFWRQVWSWALPKMLIFFPPLWKSCSADLWKHRLTLKQSRWAPGLRACIKLPSAHLRLQRLCSAVVRCSTCSPSRLGRL